MTERFEQQEDGVQLLDAEDVTIDAREGGGNGRARGRRGLLVLLLLTGRAGDAQVVQGVAEVVRLAGAAAADEDERLVAPGGQHRPVRRLRRGVDVRRHVFRFASSEQLDHLQAEIGT